MRGQLNIGVKPFLLSPIGKDYLWGGNRLNDDFAKDIAMKPLAETWECSTHPDGLCMVSSGMFAGLTLTETLKLHPEYLGMHANENGELPILIKFIDAKKDLSVQVHPDDAYALLNEHGQLGKTEMWYVLDAKKSASLIYGFQQSISKEQLRDGIEDGSIEKYLQKVHVEKDDVFFIPAGVVHAIGAGTLVAEIQENSNLTYRLYDYNRIDKNGAKRQLHIEKALDVADLNKAAEPRQPMRVLHYRKGSASEMLCHCKYFEVYRVLINTERQHRMLSYQCKDGVFEVLLCTEGCGIMFMEDGDYIELFKGDCIFVPAGAMKTKLHGKMQLLRVVC